MKHAHTGTQLITGTERYHIIEKAITDTLAVYCCDQLVTATSELSTVTLHLNLLEWHRFWNDVFRDVFQRLEIHDTELPRIRPRIVRGASDILDIIHDMQGISTR